MWIHGKKFVGKIFLQKPNKFLVVSGQKLRE